MVRGVCTKRTLCILNRRDLLIDKMDWLTVMLYMVLVLVGWLNIYAADYDVEKSISIFSLSINSGRQLLWIGVSIVTIVSIMIIDFKIYNSIAYIFYGVFILLLIGVLFTRKIGGASSWYDIGIFKFQPSELAKFATALVLAKYFSDYNPRFNHLKDVLIMAAIIAVPALLIMLQPDAGTVLIFLSFILVLYREGMSPLILIAGIVTITIVVLTLLVAKWYLVVGIALIAIVIILFKKEKKPKFVLQIIGGAVIIIGIIFSVGYVFSNVLQPHQQKRIQVLFNPGSDPLGVEWNVTQSKIAIGSGGLTGKGFLKGTQTKFNFVPEQSTDFIFSTIGEEYGWIGSSILVALFTTLFLRLIFLAERQKSRFARIYGYSVTSILFVHFTINIGMAIGLFPVIGIPLPFFSYGGSSLWAFTIFLFVFIKLDAHRMQVLKW